MKKCWLGTGWKMNHTVKDSISYVEYLLSNMEKRTDAINLFILPPYTALMSLSEMLGNSGVLFGAQNMHWQDSGAFTGEISPLMLKEIGVDLVEIGHSERRQLFCEDDSTVNLKVLSALKYSLRPIICVGEPEDVKRSGASLEYLTVQVKRALNGVSERDVEKVILAYEPVWAIGDDGEPATVEYASSMMTGIRDVLKKIYPDSFEEIPLLYGGSVNMDNAADYIEQKDIDGLFVGRAAWCPESLLAMADKLQAVLSC